MGRSLHLFSVGRGPPWRELPFVFSAVVALLCCATRFWCDHLQRDDPQTKRCEQYYIYVRESRQKVSKISKFIQSGEVQVYHRKVRDTGTKGWRELEELWGILNLQLTWMVYLSQET